MSSRIQRIRIGEVLVRLGVLTDDQVTQILDIQRFNHRPFGDLAERMFGVTPEAVEKAWEEQYLSYDTCPNREEIHVDEAVLNRVSRRQAWQFRILPLYVEDQQLYALTTRRNLKRAVNFAWHTFGEPTCFLVCDDQEHKELLMEHYPWAAMVA